jgi:tetratricopeptide (TPR) repeat protein
MEHMTDHPSLGTLYEELGSSYEALGNAEKSMEYRKEAIRIYEGFLGDHKFTATSYLGLGTTLKSQGKYLLCCNLFGTHIISSYIPRLCVMHANICH